MEKVNAPEIMRQFWQEYAFVLESNGFTVECNFGELSGTMEINIGLLRRAFDNLYSNITKYAAKSVTLWTNLSEIRFYAYDRPDY